MLSDADYRKIYKSAAALAKRRGYFVDAEDFAQECCLYAFETKRANVFTSRRFVDYLRRNYGRTGTPGGDARSSGMHLTCEYDDETHGLESCDGGGFRRLGTHLSKLSRYERIIYVLHHKYEVPLAQIADSQGISESRISQILSGIQKAIHKDLTRKESGISRLGEAEMERVLGEERERLEQQESIGMAQFESFAMEGFNASGL